MTTFIAREIILLTSLSFKFCLYSIARVSSLTNESYAESACIVEKLPLCPVFSACNN